MADAQTTAPVLDHWKRNITLFLTGQTVSLFGSMIVQYAVMWYVTIETKSGLAIALYSIAAFLPQGIVSIFGGVLADRVNRRILVITADAIIATATLVLAILMLNGITDLWIIVLAVGIRSLGAGVQSPAVTAMIPQLTPPEHLMRINGIFGTISTAMMLLAPAVAGIVFGVFGIVPVFFIDVVTAVIGIGFLALVTVPTLAAVAEKTTSYREDLVEGLRFIWHHPIVRWLLIVFALIFVLVVAPSSITPLMVARTFGDEVWKLTVLELAFSIGMLLGGVAVSTFLAKRSRMALILIATFAFGVWTIGLGLSPNLILFYAFMFLVGLFVPLFSTPVMTLLQEVVQPEMHGRVFSYVSIVMALAAPVGLAVFGPLADVISVQSLLVIGGAAMIVVMAVAIVVPSGRAAIAAARAKDPGMQDAAQDPGAGNGPSGG